MRRIGLLLSLCAAVTGAVLLVATPAGAEDDNRVADAGWWWRAQTGLLTPLPPPPGVEDGQLLIQSSPEGAQAIAAVSGVLADGQTNPILTLDVASDAGGSAAVVLACQAGSAWVGVDAGRWDSKPEVDCATSVTGLPSDDGTRWTFALGPLQLGDRFDVVLVPGLLAEADAYPSFHLTYEAPTAESITTTAGSAPVPPVPPAAPPATVATTVAPPGGPGAFTPRASAPPAASPAKVVPARPVLDAAEPGVTDSAPALQDTAMAAVEAPEPRTLARIVGVAVVLAGLGGAVLTQRRPALAGASATSDAPVLGGLARFRSERTSDPPPVT